MASLGRKKDRQGERSSGVLKSHSLLFFVYVCLFLPHPAVFRSHSWLCATGITYGGFLGLCGMLGLKPGVCVQGKSPTHCSIAQMNPSLPCPDPGQGATICFRFRAGLMVPSGRWNMGRAWLAWGQGQEGGTGHCGRLPPSCCLAPGAFPGDRPHVGKESQPPSSGVLGAGIRVAMPPLP